MSAAQPIIVFDAECVLCAANAQFVLRYDHDRRFRLASVQGPVGAALYRQFGMDPADPETLIVVFGDQALHDTDAVFAICSALRWPWRSVTALRIVPRFFRDPLYRLVARHRYRLFGRRDVCWAPSPDQVNRLL